jgi:DNA-binding MarR family transcriptional regulator
MPAINARRTPPAVQETFRALLRACGLIGRVMQPFFARFGISLSQWGTLAALHAAEREGLAGLRLTDLSGRLLIRPPSITGVVDRLQRQGLVAREASARDLRVRQVRLTPAGRSLVEQVLEQHDARIVQVLGGLSRDEQHQMYNLLERLSVHLESMQAGQGM